MSEERRGRPDNLEQLEVLEDEDDLEMTDPKETLYDTHSFDLFSFFFAIN